MLRCRSTPRRTTATSSRALLGDGRAREGDGPAAALRALGGRQDELVFDGASFAHDGDGALTYQAETFQEALDILEFEGSTVKGAMAPPLTEEGGDLPRVMTGTRATT
jgi:predicted amidohydrolase